MDVTTILFLLSDGKQQAPYFCFRMASVHLCTHFIMDVTTILFLLSDGKQQAPYFCFRMASRTSLRLIYNRVKDSALCL